MDKALLELDRQRDELRATMEDRDMKMAADEELRDPGLFRGGIARWEKRQSRRAWERKKGLVPIAPGPWSLDLDDYHDEQGYDFDLGDGYTGRLVRSDFATFNGYITLPAGHPCAKLGYWWEDETKPTMLPIPPVELTFSHGLTFGYDHCHGTDIMPVVRNGLQHYEEYNHYSRDLYRPLTEGRNYIDFSSAVEELKMLCAYFKTLEQEHWETIILLRAKIGLETDSTMDRHRQVVSARRFPALATWVAARKVRLGL